MKLSFCFFYVMLVLEILLAAAAYCLCHYTSSPVQLVTEKLSQTPDLKLLFTTKTDIVRGVLLQSDKCYCHKNSR